MFREIMQHSFSKSMAYYIIFELTILSQAYFWTIEHFKCVTIG